MSLIIDAMHRDAIREAVERCFADTGSVVDVVEVKALVDELWAAQSQRTMRAIYRESGGA